MEDPPPHDECGPVSRPHHEATWGEVIRVVKEFGGSIEKTECGYALVRVVGTMLLHFPLPIDFNPDHCDKLGAPSPMAIYSIQRNLDIKLPYYHLM